MARALEAGTVWINTYRALTFNSPFGGYKSSGIGRQNGIEAVHQYLQTKSVWCELGDEVQDPFMNEGMSFCDHCEGQRFDRAQVLRLLRATRKRPAIEEPALQGRRCAADGD